MFCPKCGTVNDDGNRFCHHCSAALPTPDGQGPDAGATATQSATQGGTAPGPRHTSPNGVGNGTPTAPGRRGKTVKRIALVLVLLVAAFIVYAALSPDEPGAGHAAATGSAAADTAASGASGTDASTSDQANAGSAAASAAPDASGTATGGDGASTASAEAAPASEAAGASADANEDVGDILTLDVFDWNAASDKMKKKMAFACQVYWKVGGVTGEPLDIASDELAKKIDAAIGDQDSVFDTACALYNIDPSAWRSTGN